MLLYLLSHILFLTCPQFKGMYQNHCQFKIREHCRQKFIDDTYNPMNFELFAPIFAYLNTMSLMHLLCQYLLYL